jgi:hypothetical protein
VLERGLRVAGGTGDAGRTVDEARPSGLGNILGRAHGLVYRRERVARAFVNLCEGVSRGKRRDSRGLVRHFSFFLVTIRFPRPAHPARG